MPKSIRWLFHGQRPDHMRLNKGCRRILVPEKVGMKSCQRTKSQQKAFISKAYKFLWKVRAVI
jgi:hypothetical protein